MSEQFDLIVLGSGSGARDGANKAAKEHDARVALKMGATVDDLEHMHHAFPTWGEGVKAAAEQARVRRGKRRLRSTIRTYAR